MMPLLTYLPILDIIWILPTITSSKRFDDHPVPENKENWRISYFLKALSKVLAECILFFENCRSNEGLEAPRPGTAQLLWTSTQRDTPSGHGAPQALPRTMSFLSSTYVHRRFVSRCGSVCSLCHLFDYGPPTQRSQAAMFRSLVGPVLLSGLVSRTTIAFSPSYDVPTQCSPFTVTWGAPNVTTGPPFVLLVLPFNAPPAIVSLPDSSYNAGTKTGKYTLDKLPLKSRFQFVVSMDDGYGTLCWYPIPFTVLTQPLCLHFSQQVELLEVYL